MTQENIYQAPQSEVAEASTGQLVLASRWARLFASIVDSIILMIAVLPIAFALGIFDGLAESEPDLMFTAVTTLLSIAAFIVLNGHLLANYGQTIGKKIFKIKIVDMEGRQVSFGKLIGLRYVPWWLVSSLPVNFNALPLVNVLFIFRRDKRCVHDLIAGTQVVNA